MRRSLNKINQVRCFVMVKEAVDADRLHVLSDKNTLIGGRSQRTGWNVVLEVALSTGVCCRIATVATLNVPRLQSRILVLKRELHEDLVQGLLRTVWQSALL